MARQDGREILGHFRRGVLTREIETIDERFSERVIVLSCMFKEEDVFKTERFMQLAHGMKAIDGDNDGVCDCEARCEVSDILISPVLNHPLLQRKGVGGLAHGF